MSDPGTTPSAPEPGFHSSPSGGEQQGLGSAPDSAPNMSSPAGHSPDSGSSSVPSPGQPSSDSTTVASQPNQPVLPPAVPGGSFQQPMAYAQPTAYPYPGAMTYAGVPAGYPWPPQPVLPSKAGFPLWIPPMPKIPSGPGIGGMVASIAALPLGVVAMIVSAVSIIGGLVLIVPTLFFGGGGGVALSLVSLRRIRRNPARYSGRGIAISGFVMGLVAVGFALIALLIVMARLA
ncbi:DUF4190 domain-containing protein [Natronoglycomyces albus]|uniref:DUF4190 domain-containing protein n=1 Tax=Natronoglycomyces albus TaxID=2811108 RepID=A0A895XLR7_9ACTN|nr:DUF4190 domain-containing protein [Natronoglycomyces albus]QSB04493.1 hypothetical protein JQS30_11990 [Natronoglycomyces albus]